MSTTLIEAAKIPAGLENSTAGVDCGAGNTEPAGGYWLMFPVTEEPEDLIRGKEARFAALASRRALRKMMSKPRDDAETA